MNIIDRISIIQQECTKSQRSFELSIGKSSGYLNQLQKKDSTPSVDVIVKIIETYPKYSLEWIILGRGEKYSENVNIVNEDAIEYVTGSKSDSKKLDVIIEQNTELAAQNTMILDKLDRSIALDTIRKIKEGADVEK